MRIIMNGSRYANKGEKKDKEGSVCDFAVERGKEWKWRGVVVQEWSVEDGDGGDDRTLIGFLACVDVR